MHEKPRGKQIGDFVLRRLTEDYAELAFQLHQAERDKMKPGQVRKYDRKFISRNLGTSFGIFYRGKLIAYGALNIPMIGNSLTKYLPESFEIAPEGVAQLDGAVVASQYRGYSLHHYLLSARIELALQLGKTHILSTTCPTNIGSLKGMLGAGLQIVEFIESVYGGWPRWLFYQDLLALQEPTTSSSLCIEYNPESISEHIALIKDGHRSFAYSHGFMHYQQINPDSGAVVCSGPIRKAKNDDQNL